MIVECFAPMGVLTGVAEIRGKLEPFMATEADLTVLLDDWVRGDKTALDRLAPLVYPELCRMARIHLRRSRSAVTLETVDVVGDLFLKLLARRPAKLDSRKHFFVLAARMMRRALIDHYRKTVALKRGAAKRVPLHENLLWVDALSEEVVEFDRALSELEELDEEQAELFSMRFLLGCSAEEVGELTGLSKATVDRRVALARAWLYKRLKPREAIGA